jgi:hypothetical protein
VKTFCRRCGIRVIPNSDRWTLIDEGGHERIYFCTLVHLALWIADGDPLVADDVSGTT